MTAGMNTRNLDAGRISLPRAGFGALIAGTLLAGSLVGAATYAAVNTASANAGDLHRAAERVHGRAQRAHRGRERPACR